MNDLSAKSPLSTLFRSSTLRRGFVLLVIIVMLGMLLALCIGFLSTTRASVRDVYHVRNKSDVTDLAASAIDWTIANICSDLIENGKFKEDAVVADVRDPKAPFYRSWYKPYESGMTIWFNKKTGGMLSTWQFTNPDLQASDEATYKYMPADYLQGGVRARFSVQVLDTNAAINVNDWNTDCSPTQCQMALMLMDAQGPTQIERARGARDGLWNWADGGPNNFNDVPTPGFRYFETWAMATRTQQGWGGDPSYSPPPSKPVGTWADPRVGSSRSDRIGYAWATSNTQTFTLRSLLGVYQNRIYTSNGRDPGPPNYHNGYAFGGWGPQENIMGFDLFSYEDPDTGRSPVNVNTCFNSGERMDLGNSITYPCYTLEGVFNVESLRRIIKIGSFWNGTAYKNAQTDALNDDEKKMVEILRVKLAYQYQETLCRYFTATYFWDYNSMGSGFRRGYHRGNPPDFPAFDANAVDNYVTAYGRKNSDAIGPVEAAKVKWNCKAADRMKARFPFGVKEFRLKIRDDLRTIAGGGDADPVLSNFNPRFTGLPKDGLETVSCDQNGHFEIAQGKLDWRTASAIFDNIIPGKAYLFSENEIIAAAPNHPAFNPDHVAEVRDPLWMLYQQRIGLDEAQDPEPYMDVLHGFVTSDTKGGKDISGARVPYRQLCFGPDWFSTELTTASPCFILIVSVQLVDDSPEPLTATIYEQRQFGVTVDIAPDVLSETDEYAASNYPAEKWPQGNFSYSDNTGAKFGDTLKSNCGLGFYRGSRPAYLKTAPASSLDSVDNNTNFRPYYDDHTQYRYADGSIYYKDKDGKPVTSAAREWVDYRGVKDPATYYRKDTNQVKKAIRIRGIWNLNDSQN